MNKTWKHRAPAVFRLNQDDLTIESASKRPASLERRVQVQSEPEFEALAITDHQEVVSLGECYFAVQ